MSNDDDSELERLKAKRLEEMQRNISNRQTPESSQQSGEGSEQQQQSQKPSPRDIVVSNLGYRGMEVLQNAEFQFPNEVPHVIQKLAELFSSGEINEQLDGGKLLSLFRTIGLNIRMNTKIHVEKDGRFVSLSDKLGSDKTSGDGDT